MDVGTYQVLVARARSIGVVLLCGAVLTACGGGTANVSAGDAPLSNASAGKSEKSAVITSNAADAHVPPASASTTPNLKATETFLAPISASKTWDLNATTSINGNALAPTIQADSITLSWAAPTENTDGSALTDLSGYEILYGTSASALSQKISIETVGVSNYVVENLGSGTWYFEVVAVNTLGIESAPSSIVTITI